MSDLKEGIDFYFDENGKMVLSTHFLSKRGHCCQSGCINCPYGIHDKFDSNIPQELQCKEETSESEVYDGEIDPEFDL